MERKTIIINKFAHSILKKESKRRRANKEVSLSKAISDIGSEYIIEYSKQIKESKK